MGRWTQFDEDAYRLPEGFVRTGYDTDTQRYYFKFNEDGSTWENVEPGAVYSEMRKIKDGPVGYTKSTDAMFCESDDEESESESLSDRDDSGSSDDGTAVSPTTPPSISGSSQHTRVDSESDFVISPVSSTSEAPLVSSGSTQLKRGNSKLGRSLTKSSARAVEFAARLKARAQKRLDMYEEEPDPVAKERTLAMFLEGKTQQAQPVSYPSEKKRSVPEIGKKDSISEKKLPTVPVILPASKEKI